MDKINGNINKVRQVSMGVETYVGLSAKDERVRLDHQHKDGKNLSMG